MVIKILSSAATFNAIKYNFEKLSSSMVGLNDPEKFGQLEALDHIRQEDYKDYLQMVSARNTCIKHPQFHAVISTKGKSHSKADLNEI